MCLGDQINSLVNQELGRKKEEREKRRKKEIFSKTKQKERVKKQKQKTNSLFCSPKIL